MLSRRRFLRTASGTVAVLSASRLHADPALPRCRLLPLPNHEAAFLIDGDERLRWHFDKKYPRPFFYPLNGPSGKSLTRMGHPGAPNHDHHRSVWFAHNDVQTLNFWGDTTEARIRQKSWLAYQDGDAEAVMACTLGWFANGDQELMEQQLVAAVRPGPGKGETFLELQSTFTPGAESLELGKTNFGFLAVRVAKSLSGFFGGGIITNSESLSGEPAVFGKRARWMDYSGPVSAQQVEGITYFDHPGNPRYPTHWHVREDGWMGASFCFAEPYTIVKDQPLTIRYLLHAHAGPYDPKTAQKTAEEFAALPPFQVLKSKAKHHHYEVRRK